MQLMNIHILQLHHATEMTIYVNTKDKLIYTMPSMLRKIQMKLLFNDLDL